MTPTETGKRLWAAPRLELTFSAFVRTEMAVVLLEGDAGFARVAGVNLEKSVTVGLPDEVILFTDAEE